MTYDEALILADELGYRVEEVPLQASDGRIIDRDIYLRRDATTVKKKDTLCEEVSHGLLTVGNILDQDDVMNRKQERRARLLAYGIQMILPGLIEAKAAGCANAYEIADYLNVSEDTLREALETYRQIYGIAVRYEDYIIRFEPALEVYRYMQI